MLTSVIINQDGTVTYIAYLNIHIDTYVRLILITNTVIYAWHSPQ